MNADELLAQMQKLLKTAPMDDVLAFIEALAKENPELRDALLKKLKSTPQA